MTEKEILQILRKGFNKLTLKKVRKAHGFVSFQGKKLEKYLGLFQFKVPTDIKIESNQINFLLIKKLLYKLKKELSNNFVIKKIIRKVIKNDIVVKKQIIRYIFNIGPKNVVSFRYFKNKRLIKIVITGCCLK